MVEKGKIPEELPGRTLLVRTITPERALAEFRVAVEVWFKYMDEETKREALGIVRGKCDANYV